MHLINMVNVASKMKTKVYEHTKQQHNHTHEHHLNRHCNIEQFGHLDVVYDKKCS
jgi:hypothetical protein